MKFVLFFVLLMLGIVYISVTEYAKFRKPETSVRPWKIQLVLMVIGLGILTYIIWG